MGNSPLQVLYETCKSGGSGDEERVRKILKNNPNLINEDLDIYGDTILILASANNHIKLIKLLLLYNTININKQNTGGWTALHNASLFGHKEIVELLLSHSNININIQGNDGNSALYYAASRGDKEIVELLLSHSNIDINIKKNDGDTALHSASFNGRKDIVKLLLSHSNIDINIQNNDGKLASHICCDAIANKPNKPIILELFENHSKAKTALTSSTLTTTKLLNEGSLSSNNVIPQTALKESRIVKEVKDKELLTLVEEKESPKLQIEGLEEKMREITNNSMKEMERHLQEKENYMKEMDYMKNNRNEIVRVLQDSKKLMVDNLMKEMGKVVNSIKEHVDEKEKECQRLQDQIVRMEYRFEERMKKMEGIMNKLERSNDDLERRLEEKEKECDQLEDQIVRIEGRFESWMKQMESNVDKAIKSKLEDNKRSLVLKSLPLPPNKQTHVFLTHTWREDEKRRNNHDRVGRVNEALQKRGLVTWFDSERLEDKIHETISKALYSTCCVLIFVTREYEKKVNSADDSDYCFYEFNVAAIDRRLANMRIPIVMDGSMLNPDSWEEGLLKAGLGGKVFIDVSSDDKDVFEERCNEVFVRVVKLLNI